MLDIVVPLYKGRDTIEDLFNSMLAQTKKMFMVHVVQDCDNEDYTDIYQKYTEKGLHLDWIALDENVGPGQARQYALHNMCVGDYVMFADADDMLMPHAVESLYNTAKRENADIVVGTILLEKKAVGCTPISAERSITWLHGKIYNRDFLGAFQIKFKEGVRINEDGAFNALAFWCSRKTLYLQEQCYLWRECKSSLTRKSLLNYHKKGMTQYIIACCDSCLKANVLNRFTEQDAINYICAFYTHYQTRNAIQGETWLEEYAYLRAFFDIPVVQKTVKFYKNWQKIAKQCQNYNEIEKNVYFFSENIAQWVSHFIPIEGVIA